MIARLNMGGPAHHAALLSGRRFDPDRFETLLVHGRLAAGEESAAYLAEDEGAQTVFLPSLAQPVDPRSDLRSLAALTRLIRRFQPQIVDTHTAKAGVVGRLSALLAGRPRPVIVHTYHGHVLEGYFGKLKTGTYRRLESGLGRVSDALLGVSQATVDDLVRLRVAPPERFRVVPLGLDLGDFTSPDKGAGAALRAELSIDQEEAVFAYVGRIVPIKRLDLMVAAFARAVSRDATARLVIVGDGEARPSLEAQARSLGVERRVHFLGYRRDIGTIAAAADVAILSSENEGTPVWLIEAAAAGLPAVATAVGGVPEVVSPETGILVPRGDEHELAAAVERMAKDSEMREAMGERARGLALERFSVERLLSDMRSLYLELLESR